MLLVSYYLTLSGTERYKLTVQELEPRVNARFLKIIPKHWTKDERACMKVEILGCGLQQGYHLEFDIRIWLQFLSMGGIRFFHFSFNANIIFIIYHN